VRAREARQAFFNRPTWLDETLEKKEGVDYHTRRIAIKERKPLLLIYEDLI